MADKYSYKSKLKKGNTTIEVLLNTYIFMEDDMHYVYAPQLDITGYGSNEDEAKRSFSTMLEEFVDYTINKRTLASVMRSLGWEVKGKSKLPKKLKAPDLSEMIRDNEVLYDIVNNKEYAVQKREVGIPQFA